MIIREATEDDNQALLELSRQTPMESGLSIFVDRSPDYFYLASLQGENHRVIVAERKGEIIGAIGFCYRKIRLFGREVKASYIGGMKVTEAGRRTTALYRIIRRIYKELMEEGVEIGMGSFLEGNEKARRIFEKGFNFPVFHPVAVIKILHIIPLWGKGRETCDISIAESSDLDELGGLFHKFYKKYELIEDFSRERLESILERSKDFSLENFLLLRREGRIVAALSFWDQRNFKRTIIRRYGPGTKMLYYMLKPLKIFPPEGEPLNVVEIRHMVYEEGRFDDMKRLLSCFLRRIWPGYKVVKVGVDSRDPLLEVFKGLPKVETNLVFSVATAKPDPDLIDRLRSSLIWEDMTLH